VSCVIVTREPDESIAIT